MSGLISSAEEGEGVDANGLFAFFAYGVVGFALGGVDMAGGMMRGTSIDVV